MSIGKRIALGVTANWISRAVAIVMGVIVLPVLFRNLSKEELGAWLLLGQSAVAFGIFEFGFGVTLSRRVAFAKGKSSSDPAAPLSEASLLEIADLITTGERIYRFLSLFAFVFSFALGFLYLRSLHLTTIPMAHVWIAWTILCLSQAFGIWANVWNCVLLGVGYVGWDAIICSISNSLTLLAQIAAVLSGGGLITLAAVAAAGALVQRFVLLSFTRRRRPEIFARRGSWHPEAFRQMVPLAMRAWITDVGAAIVLCTDQLFIASYTGASSLPAYRAAFVLTQNFALLANALGAASMVFVSHLWQEGDLAGVHRIVRRNLGFCWLVMLSSSAFLIVFGQQTFDVWLGPGNFIGLPILCVFLGTEVITTQSYVISLAARATEDEAFAFCSLASGILKLIFSYFFIRYFGLLGLASATALAMLLASQWYMVYRGLRRIEFSFSEYFRMFLPFALLFLVLLSALIALSSLLGEISPILQLVCAAAVSGLAFAGAAYFLIFDRSQVLGLLRQVKRSKC